MMMIQATDPTEDLIRSSMNCFYSIQGEYKNAHGYKVLGYYQHSKYVYMVPLVQLDQRGRQHDTGRATTLSAEVAVRKQTGCQANPQILHNTSYVTEVLVISGQ